MKIRQERLTSIIIIFIYIIVTGSLEAFYPVIFIAIIFFIMVINQCAKKKRLLFTKKAAIWLLFPLGIILANNYGSTHWIKPFIIFTLLALIVGISKPLKLQKSMNWLYSIVVVSIVGALSVIIQLFAPEIYSNNIYLLYKDDITAVLLEQIATKSYFSGFFCTPAIAATIIICGILVLSTVKSKNKIAWGILLLGLISTGKRSHLLFGLIVLGISYLLGIDDKTRFNRTLKLVFIGIIVVVFFGVFITYAPTVKFGAVGRIIDAIKSVMDAHDEITLNYATAGRYSTYLEAWNYFIKYPIRGIGWNNFSAINYNEYLGTNLTNVHNVYIQILCDSGIIGFMCFMIPVLYSLVWTFKYYKKDIMCRYSFLFQCFFVLLCFTETVLDFMLLYVTYFFCLCISFSHKGMEVNEL